MDKYEYEAKINIIKKLERQTKKLKYEEHYLHFTKPSILEIKKRQEWKIKKNKLKLKQKNINYSLLIAYTELEKLF